MKKLRMDPHRAFLFPLALIALSLSACVISPATVTREANFNISGPAELNVSGLNGKIEITGSSDNVVAVQSFLRDPDRLHYEAVQNGNQITVTASRVGSWWVDIFGGPAADILVTVPVNTTLTLETSNGRINVTGTNGGGTLKTSNGAITLQNVNGRFNAYTSNGRIDITGLNGSGFIRTSNGGVDLQDAAGYFDVSTSNAAITFIGEMKPGGQNRLTSSNGAVDIELKGTPSVNLDASTSNGIIDCKLPILMTTSGSNSLSGKIGAGDAELYIRTSNAHVAIR